jgi:hypothetical protein
MAPRPSMETRMSALLGRRVMKAYVLAVAAVCILVARSAFAAPDYQNYYIHGRSCTSITPGQTAVYSNWGVESPSTGAIDVMCPIVLNYPRAETELTSVWVMVSGYNRAGYNTLNCTVASTSRWDGTGQVSTRVFLPFRNDNPLPPQFDGAQFVPNDAFLTVICRLPGYTATGRSHLTGIWLQVAFGR